MGVSSNMTIAAAIGCARRGGEGHGVGEEGGHKKGKARGLENNRSARWCANFWLGSSLRRNSWEVALILSQTSPRRKKNTSKEKN